VNLVPETPRLQPEPVPESTSETSPLVRACAAADQLDRNGHGLAVVAADRALPARGLVHRRPDFTDT
jgi:hypothetical protein